MRLRTGALSVKSNPRASTKRLQITIINDDEAPTIQAWDDMNREQPSNHQPRQGNIHNGRIFSFQAKKGSVPLLPMQSNYVKISIQLPWKSGRMLVHSWIVALKAAASKINNTSALIAPCLIGYSNPIAAAFTLFSTRRCHHPTRNHVWNNLVINYVNLMNITDSDS